MTAKGELTIMEKYMRLESDSIGTMEVPEDAYYGVQALRAKENFPITAPRSIGQPQSPAAKPEN